MTDAGYVISGWVITGGALAAYAVALQRRLKRAADEEIIDLRDHERPGMISTDVEHELDRR